MNKLMGENHFNKSVMLPLNFIDVLKFCLVKWLPNNLFHIYKMCSFPENFISGSETLLLALLNFSI